MFRKQMLWVITARDLDTKYSKLDIRLSSSDLAKKGY